MYFLILGVKGSSSYAFEWAGRLAVYQVIARISCLKVRQRNPFHHHNSINGFLALLYVIVRFVCPSGCPSDRNYRSVRSR